MVLSTTSTLSPQHHRRGFSTIVVEFNAQADIPKSIQDLKDEVDTAVPELPGEAEDPFVSDINFSEQPIMFISITGDVPIERFVRIAEEVEDEIRSVRGISRVTTSGMRDREVQIIVDKAALSNFDVSLGDVVQAISASNATIPIGSIEIDGINYNIQFDGDIEDPQEIGNIALFSSGETPVFVRDVAFVSDSLEDTTSFSRISLDGQPAVQSLSLSVFKRGGGDITRIARDVRAKVDELKEPGELLYNTETLVFLDSGELVEEDLITLTKTGMQTVGLVMLLLFVTIGWRESLVAGLAIPLSFLVAFIGLEESGNTLNFVSLFSLILAVGILVDSAIVMVEAINTRMKQQMDKKEAVLDAIGEYHWPLTSGTMTTVAVFAPLFTISGVTGEFIATIPFTIIFLLIASLIVALGFIPLIASNFLRRRSTTRFEQRQEELAERFREWYKKNSVRIIGHKRRETIFMVLIAIAFIVSMSLPFIGAVKVIFFEEEDADFMFIDIELPEGSILAETDLEVRKVEEILYSEPRIESFITTVGGGSEFADGGSGSKFGNISITLRDDRSSRSSVILEELRSQLNLINTSEVRIFQPSSGPPTGDPIVVSLLGDDFDDLNDAAANVAAVLKSIEGTADVRASTRDDALEFVLKIDNAKATELGLNPTQVASTLRTAVRGTTATTIKKQGEDIDVVVKLNLNSLYRSPHDTNRTTIDSIRNLELKTPQGTVLLGSVLDVTIAKSSNVIRHDNKKRVVTVNSQLTDGTNTFDVLRAFEEEMPNIQVPDGVEISLGGENEDVDQSFRDMGRAMVMGLILMLAVLVLQFNSFRFAFYVLSIVPFSLIGVMVGLAVTGKALSFVSILGFIALSGIVVNNSIILIDVMNKLRIRNPNMTIDEIVVEGTSMRLRPILLTALTTVVGIFPLTFASELWAPLAFAIMFGLSFSVIITLLLIPIIYRRWPGKLAGENKNRPNVITPSVEKESNISIPELPASSYTYKSFDQ